MSQVPDETTSDPMIAVNEEAASPLRPAPPTSDSSSSSDDAAGASLHAAEADGGESEGGEATDEDAPEASAEDGAAPGKRKRRRRRKRKGGEPSAAGEPSVSDASAAPSAPAGRPERAKHALPFERFFGEGPGRKSAFAMGEIVGGRVVAVEHGVAVLDLFGRAVAYALEDEPREIPVLADPATDDPEGSEGSSAGEALAPSEQAGGGEDDLGDANDGAPSASTASVSEAAEEASNDEAEEAPAQIEEVERPRLVVGDVLRARIASVAGSGQIALANRVVIRAESRARLAVAREAHRRVWGTVYGFNRGGFDVLVDGIRAFCPASGMSLEPIDDPRALLGRRLEFSVQATRSGQQGVVVSRRSLLERELRRKVRELRRHLEVGKRVRGKVTGVREYGFFVDLGGLEGLVHMSEVSWDRQARPSDVVSVGDEVEVMVVRLGGPEGRGEAERGGRDRRDQRVGLSLKACRPNPWDEKIGDLAEGTVRKGRITRTTEFGAFVELVPGVEGLLHISELGRDLKHASERVREGEEILVVVERIDTRAKRISLSKLSDADRKLFEEGGELSSASGPSLRVGAHLKVKVEKVEPVGVFVQVEGVIGRRGRGFIPNAEMGTERGTDHRKRFPAGTAIDVKVIGLDRDGGLRLSRKGFHNDEERRAVQDYRREAATKGFGTFGDLLRSKLQKD